MAKVYVVDKYPAEYASGVYINDVVWAQFSVPISSGTATYYNFTVNEKNTYEPVAGHVEVHGISGGLNDAIIVFIPEDGFARLTEYSVIVSTGIKARDTADQLVDDYVWYFTTCSTASSGSIGETVYDLPASGFTDLTPSSVYPLDSSSDPLEVLETSPADYASNINRALPYIGIRFNAVIPSGIDLYDHISITPRKVLG